MDGLLCWALSDDDDRPRFLFNSEATNDQRVTPGAETQSLLADGAVFAAGLRVVHIGHSIVTHLVIHTFTHLLTRRPAGN